MPIAFEESAAYWLAKSKEAKKYRQKAEALGYAYRALSVDGSFAYGLAYAQCLYEVGQYDMSATVCLRLLREADPKERKAVAKLMADNATKAGNFAAALHYHNVYMHGDEGADDKRSKVEDALYEFLENFGMDEEEEDEGPMLLSEAEEKRQMKAYEAMFYAYNAENSVGVLEAAEEIAPDFEHYAECLFMVGMSHAKLGNPEEGKRCLLEMYERTDHDTRVLYYLDEIGDGLTDEEMAACLAKLTPDGNDDNMAMASICAYLHGLHKTALYYAQEAQKLLPEEPEYLFRLAGAYLNVGDREMGEAWLDKALRLYAGFFPSILRELPLEAPVNLQFEVMPEVLYDELFAYLFGQMRGEYVQVLMQTDATFREAVRFLLTAKCDPVKQSKLAGEAVRWMTPEGIAFQRELLLSPDLEPGVQYRVVYNLLEKVRKGDVWVTVDYIADAYKLRVPASFADFGEQMKRIYVYAYCEMVRERQHRELKLARVCEKLYLLLPEGYYQANVMGYAVTVATGIADKRKWDKFGGKTRGFDQELLSTYVELVKETLKNA